MNVFGGGPTQINKALVLKHLHENHKVMFFMVLLFPYNDINSVEAAGLYDSA